MNINEVYDPFENAEDTAYTDTPSRRRTSIRRILTNFANRRQKGVQVLIPPVERKNPGITYIKSGPGDSDSRMVWLDSKLIYNPVFKYAIFREKRGHPYDTDRMDKWLELFPSAQKLGGIGLVEDDEDSYNDADVLQLVQFDDYESLQQFKLTSDYVPIHTMVPPPKTNTKLIFKDTDAAQLYGWIFAFKDTDFNKEEILGIAANYHDFDRMEMIFLGDTRSLNSCYRAIGGQAHYAWLSHRLAKEYKEKGL